MMMVRDRLVTITRAGRPANTHRKPRITITAHVCGDALPRLLPREAGESKRQLSARSRDLTSAFPWDAEGERCTENYARR